ncbi:hypothetical protein AAY473_016295 [Plecturocebus cupreus]
MPANSVSAGTTGIYHNTWLIFSFLVKIGSHHVALAGLEFLGSSNPPAFASLSAGITGMSHCAQPAFLTLSNQDALECSGTIMLTAASISKMRFHHVGQAGLELPTSGDPPKITSGDPDLRWTLALLPRLEYRGAISAHGNLRLPDSSSSSASASQVAGITGTRHHIWLFCVFSKNGVLPHGVLLLLTRLEGNGVTSAHRNLHLLGSSDSPASVSQRWGFLQTSLELLTSGDPSASASQSAGITGLSHRTQPKCNTFLWQCERCEKGLPGKGCSEPHSPELGDK